MSDYQKQLHRELYNYLRWYTLPPGETMYANRITYTKKYPCYFVKKGSAQ